MAVLVHGSVVCPFCGCGCGMYLAEWGKGLFRAAGMESHPSSRGRLCYRGWQVGDLTSSPLHLTSPLVRRGTDLIECSYQDAIAYAAEALQRAKEVAEPIWVVGAPHLTNEEAFATARLASEVLQTPYKDSLARAADEAAVWHLQYALGEPYRTPPLEELGGRDLVLVLNSNLGTEHPQAYAWVMRAQQRGAKIVVLDEVDQGLGRLADVYVRQAPGWLEVAIEMFIQATTGLDVGAGQGNRPSISGAINAEALNQAGALLSAARAPAIVASSASLPTPASAAKIGELLLALRSGKAEDAQVYLMRSEANSLGVTLMGLAPAAGASVDLEGLLESDRSLSAMVVVDDDLGRWVGAEGLAQLRPRLGTLVVLSAFDSPTVQTADVVLPVATVGEREGSVVGQDGRVWWLEAVADAPGEARSVVQALADLSEQMGGEATGPELDKVWQVMTAEVMECSRLDLQSLRAGEPGMVHHGVLTQPTGSPDPANQPHEPLGRAEGREWVLVSRRDENSWAFDPRMRAANLLERDLRRTRAPYVYLNADDIGKLQTRAGRKVEVSTVFGTAEVEIRALEGVPPGVVVLPQQFADTRRTLMGGGEVVAPGGRWWRPVWAAVRASR